MKHERIGVVRALGFDASPIPWKLRATISRSMSGVVSSPTCVASLKDAREADEDRSHLILR